MMFTSSLRMKECPKYEWNKYPYWLSQVAWRRPASKHTFKNRSLFAAAALNKVISSKYLYFQIEFRQSNYVQFRKWPIVCFFNVLFLKLFVDVSCVDNYILLFLSWGFDRAKFDFLFDQNDRAINSLVSTCVGTRLVGMMMTILKLTWWEG